MTRGTPPGTSGIALGQDEVLTGFVAGKTSVSGGLHVHIGFSIQGHELDPPSAGIYVAALRLGMEGLSDSHLAYFLLAAGDPAPPALAASRAHLSSLPSVPEPSTARALLAGAIVLLTTRIFLRRPTFRFRVRTTPET